MAVCWPVADSLVIGSVVIDISKLSKKKKYKPLIKLYYNKRKSYTKFITIGWKENTSFNLTKFFIKKIANIPECILLKNTEMKDSSDNILWESQLKENAASNMYTHDMLLVTDIRIDSI